MAQCVFRIVYCIGWAFLAIIRILYRWRARTNRVVVDRTTAREQSLLALPTVGMIALPLIDIFTPWLSFAGYQLPPWTRWPGAASFAVALWLFRPARAVRKRPSGYTAQRLKIVDAQVS